MLLSETAPGLTIFVVYERPSDFPDSYVVRRHVVQPGGLLAVDKEPLSVAATLDEVRSALPTGLFRIGRFTADDPVIKEVWI
jgi:hypothetical protein